MQGARLANSTGGHSKVRWRAVGGYGATKNGSGATNNGLRATARATAQSKSIQGGCARHR